MIVTGVLFERSQRPDTQTPMPTEAQLRYSLVDSIPGTSYCNSNRVSISTNRRLRPWARTLIPRQHLRLEHTRFPVWTRSLRTLEDAAVTSHPPGRNGVLLVLHKRAVAKCGRAKPDDAQREVGPPMS